MWAWLAAEPAVGSFRWQEDVRIDGDLRAYGFERAAVTAQAEKAMGGVRVKKEIGSAPLSLVCIPSAPSQVWL